jgi:hypothetical protein
MHNLPPLLPALLFAGAFFALCTALGRRFLSLVRLAPSALHPVECFLLEITTGMGLIPILPIALGLFGALSALSMKIATLALALLLAPDLWRVAQDLGKSASSLRVSNLPWPAKVWAGALAALLLVLLAHSMFLGFTDDDGYHLAVPMRWLWEGTLSYLPSYTHTNAGLAFESAYAIALAFNMALGAKLMHFGAGLLVLIAVLACGRRLGAPVVGLATVSLLMISTPLNQTPLLFTWAYADFPVCLSVLVALLLWMTWRETGEQKLLWCLALCAGFTASFKFTALAVLFAWVSLVALEFYNQRRSLLSSLIQLFKFGLIALVPTLPWFARNWYWTGNPVYPMASSLIPSRDWTPEQAEIFGRYVKYFAWAVDSGASLAESKRKLLLLVAALWVVAGSALLYWLVKDRRLRLLTCFSAVYVLICIALTGLVFRYWLPGMICILLVVCTAVAQFLRRHLSIRPLVHYLPAVAFMTIALGVQARQEMRQGFLPRDLRVLTGISTHAEETAGDPAEQTWRFMQQSTPKDARFLVAAFYSSFGASSFGCFRAQRHCFTTDSHLQTYINLTDWTDFLRSVKRANIQYLLISDTQFSPNRQGFSYPAGKNEYPFCVRLAQEAGTKVFQAGHFQVFRLDGLGAMVTSQ